MYNLSYRSKVSFSKCMSCFVFIVFRLREPKLETRKRCNRLNEEPHSLLDEQMKLATALSTSMCSSGRYTFSMMVLF